MRLHFDDRKNKYEILQQQSKNCDPRCCISKTSASTHGNRILTLAVPTP
jgi:hypothetical protein